MGMPNVGKSTLYNTLTKCSIPAENFPFCTIEPNEVSAWYTPTVLRQRFSACGPFAESYAFFASFHLET